MPRFHMPAEWLPHQGCWMAWPSNPAIWTNGMEAARRNFAEVVRAIADFEPVHLLVRPADLAAARTLCGGDIDYLDDIDYLGYPLDDSWMRDFGPTFVVDGTGGIAGVNWRFNGWGKYPHANDQGVARFVLDRLGLPCLDAPLVLEGGSIHVDGEGTVLTTAQCLLHPNRNPELDQARIEALVLEYLGAEKMIWLPHGIADDDTDGHIDEVACFVAPGVAIALVGTDPADADYAPLQRNLAALRQARDARGRALQIVEMQQPAIVHQGGRRLSQSYVNFYIANGGVVMPAFGDRRRDERARAQLQELFPDRAVRQVLTHELAHGGGNIHCITQQQPLAGAGGQGETA